MGRKINCVLGTRGGVVLPEGRRQKAPLGCFFFFPDLFAEGAHVCTAACAVCLLPGMPRKREAF